MANTLKVLSLYDELAKEQQTLCKEIQKKLTSLVAPSPPQVTHVLVSHWYGDSTVEEFKPSGYEIEKYVAELNLWKAKQEVYMEVLNLLEK